MIPFIELHSQGLKWRANIIMRTTHIIMWWNLPVFLVLICCCRRFSLLLLLFFLNSKQNKTDTNAKLVKKKKKKQQQGMNSQLRIPFKMCKNRFCQLENGKSLHKFECILKSVNFVTCNRFDFYNIALNEAERGKIKIKLMTSAQLTLPAFFLRCCCCCCCGRSFCIKMLFLDRHLLSEQQ